MTGKDASGGDSALSLLLSEAASAAEKGNSDLAETLYKQALRKAEQDMQPHASVVRKVLLEMAAFYELGGKQELAEGLRARVQNELS